MPPSLVTSAANATKTVGESVKFECSFTGIPNPNIHWFYMPSGGSRVQLTQTDRYVITSGTLEIKQILKNDEGMYICRAVNVAGSLESSAYLRVKGIIIFHLLERFSFECREVIGFALCMPHDSLAPLFHPIRCKTKTNRDSLTHVFPHFVSAVCNYFEF